MTAAGAVPLLEEDEDTPTNPGVVDPVVREAIASLRRVQADTARRASDIAQLLVRKKTPVPR